MRNQCFKEDFDLVLEGTLTRVLGLGIRHLKFFNKRIVLAGFSLERRGFGHD